VWAEIIPLEPDPGNAGVGNGSASFFAAGVPDRVHHIFWRWFLVYKRVVLLLVLLMGICTLFAKGELVVYTYDSFLAGPAQKIFPKFERMYDCTVKAYSFGDAGNLLARLILEKGDSKADVIIGLDQTLLLKAVEEGVLQPYKPINYTLIKDEGLLDPSWHGIPYDFGSIAIVYDSQEVESPPRSFQDLLDPRWRRALIVEDPRTSSTGLAFLLWTVAVFGEEGFEKFWRALKPNILTVTPGWDEAFQLFEQGEAPLMVSYATDGAYSYHEYGSTRYRAVIPEEGAYVQIEYVGIVKGSSNLELAKRFVEFVLMDAFQKELPLTQWMYPVTDVELPEAYKYAAKIEKVLTLPTELIKSKQEEWVKKWVAIISE